MRVIQGATWIDPEEYAYPAGSLRQSRRKALVRFPDGKLRTVTLGIPDTYFTIPARSAHHGHGYVDSHETPEGVCEFRFNPKARASK